MSKPLTNVTITISPDLYVRLLRHVAALSEREGRAVPRREILLKAVTELLERQGG